MFLAAREESELTGVSRPWSMFEWPKPHLTCVSRPWSAFALSRPGSRLPFSTTVGIRQDRAAPAFLHHRRLRTAGDVPGPLFSTAVGSRSDRGASGPAFLAQVGVRVARAAPDVRFSTMGGIHAVGDPRGRNKPEWSYQGRGRRNKDVGITKARTRRQRLRGAAMPRRMSWVSSGNCRAMSSSTKARA